MSVLGAAPWRRAPGLLRHHPAVLAGVFASSVILAASAASLPLYESSSAGGALAVQTAPVCPWGLGLRAVYPAASAAQLVSARTSAAAQAARVAHLGPPVETTFFGIQPTVQAGNGAKQAVVELLGRDNFAANISVVQRGAGPGVWINDVTAAQLGAGAGSTIQLSTAGHMAGVAVAGVYHNLSLGPLPPFWCSLPQYLYEPLSNNPPPPAILADPATVTDLGRRLGATASTVLVEFGFRSTGLTIPGSRHQVADYQRLQATADEQVANQDFRRGPILDRVVPAGNDTLTLIVPRAIALRNALSEAVSPVGVAGLVVSFLLVAAAGSFWVDRRRVEVALYESKGVGPVAQGLKVALEAAPPAVAGGMAGWGLARLLVQLFGPSPAVDTAALDRSILFAGLAVVSGVIVLGAVGAVRVAALGRSGSPGRHRWLRRVPWELVPVGAAVVVYRASSHVRLAFVGQANTPHLNPALLSFPLLLATVGVAVGIRLFGLALPFARRLGPQRLPAWFLAGRRLAAAPTMVLTLLAATALSVAVIDDAGILTTSESHALTAKSHTYVGSDMAVTLPENGVVPPALAARATVVRRFQGIDAGGQTVDVLAVDPATFARGAYWEANYARSSLGALLALLQPVGPSAPLRVVQGNGVVAPGRFTFADIVDARALPVQVVGSAATFPGEKETTTVAVVNWFDLAPRLGNRVAPIPELWAHGYPLQRVLDVLHAAGELTGSFVTANVVLDVSSFKTIGWTFNFLRSLGFLIAIVTIAGLLLYLQGRARSRVLAYGLARRMGLARRSHRRALVAEIGAVLGTGLVFGTLLAVGGAALVASKVDPLPAIPPLPTFKVPVLTLVVVALTVIVVCRGAGGLAQRSADRASVTEALRGGE